MRWLAGNRSTAAPPCPGAAGIALMRHSASGLSGQFGPSLVNPAQCAGGTGCLGGRCRLREQIGGLVRPAGLDCEFG